MSRGSHLDQATAIAFALHGGNSSICESDFAVCLGGMSGRLDLQVLNEYECMNRGSLRLFLRRKFSRGRDKLKTHHRVLA